MTVFPAGHVEPPGIQVLGEAMSEAKSKSLAALTSRVAAFEVPATGQTVILRRWSATERQTFQRLVKAQPDGEPLPDLYEQLLIRSLSDEGGNRLYHRLDRYAEEWSRTFDWVGIRIVNWHRPLSAYMSAYLRAGLILREFLEPVPVDRSLQLHPDFEDWFRVPLFNVMKWQKPAA